MRNEQFDRQIGLFGEEGQHRLHATTIAVVGIGGLGSHVVQQLALLGVGKIVLIEREELETSNKNRHVCAWAEDRVPGTLKNHAAARHIGLLNPSVVVVRVDDDLLSERAFAAVRSADLVMGCVDNEGARLVLTELCAAYERPYIDLASDVVVGSPPQYGGRILCAIGGGGCLACMKQLDRVEAAEDLESPEQRHNRMAIYGVDRVALGRSGPSVVSINGVVASLGVTEAMAFVTRLRQPQRLLRYNGSWGTVNASIDEPLPGCYFCRFAYGRGDAAEVHRYLQGRGSIA